MTESATLIHHLERTLIIGARRETVFRFFTDPIRWASWWGAGSTIEPHPSGRVLIRYPGGTEAVGEVLEIDPPERLVFTYGYAKGVPVAPGASLVTITLEDHGGSTRLRLTHAFSEPRVRDEHLQGWRYQLSLFANIVANELHGDSARLVDRWFAVWSEPDAGTRESELRAIASDDIRVRDRFSALDGMDDLASHIAASLRFMPGVRLQRAGDVRQCQGMAVSDWLVLNDAGEQRATGLSVFELGADGRIRSVTGFWSQHPLAPASGDQT
jgi:uncharacterized protein YndB with AHSA1/START domain